MKQIFAHLRLWNVLPAVLLACLTMPVFAQNARLELKNLEKLTALASDTHRCFSGRRICCRWRPTSPQKAAMTHAKPPK